MELEKGFTERGTRDGDGVIFAQEGEKTAGGEGACWVREELVFISEGQRNGVEGVWLVKGGKKGGRNRSDRGMLMKRNLKRNKVLSIWSAMGQSHHIYSKKPR